MPKQITIFEGADCSGKTSAAKTFAEKHDAVYVHFPAMMEVKTDLPRMYIEAMLPALLGYQNVVLDRSWLSETPYSTVFRDGKSRLDKVDIAMLELVATKCQASVILCQPSYITARKTFEKRLSEGGEMLESIEQHKRVWNLYDNLAMETSLPVFYFDYESENICSIYIHCNTVSTVGMKISGATKKSGGVFIVGDFMPTTGNHDTLAKFPCVQFSLCAEKTVDNGIELINIFKDWLPLISELVINHGVNVANISWVDINQPLDFIYNHQPSVVFALGLEASKLLYKYKIMSTTLPEPADVVANPEVIQDLVQAIKGFKL